MSSLTQMGIIFVVMIIAIGLYIASYSKSNASPATTQVSSKTTTLNSSTVSGVISNNSRGGSSRGYGGSGGGNGFNQSGSYTTVSGSCGINSTFFSATPIALSNFSSITPLGWMSGGGHVLPSDHIYFQFNPIGAVSSNWLNNIYNASVYAPGNVTIYQISGQSYFGGGINSGSDYSITFAPCSNVSFYFHHVRVLSNKLLSNYTSSTTGQCGNSTINVGQVRNCNKIVNIKVKAGELLGYAGRVPGQGGSSSLDFGVYDMRTIPLVYANASRYMQYQFHVACPINYYPQSMQNALLAKMAVGNTTRTQPPLCGQNDYDVIGTAQGNWFSAGTPTPYFDEGKLISLARSNFNPSIGVFSTGSSSSIAGFSGVVYYFSPGTGLVNRNFSEVTANGNIYCYGSLKTLSLSQGASGIVLLQLLNANTLRLEYQGSGTCSSGPWSFTANRVDFYR